MRPEGGCGGGGGGEENKEGKRRGGRWAEGGKYSSRGGEGIPGRGGQKEGRGGGRRVGGRNGGPKWRMRGAREVQMYEPGQDAVIQGKLIYMPPPPPPPCLPIHPPIHPFLSLHSLFSSPHVLAPCCCCRVSDLYCFFVRFRFTQCNNQYAPLSCIYHVRVRVPSHRKVKGQTSQIETPKLLVATRTS